MQIKSLIEQLLCETNRLISFVHLNRTMRRRWDVLLSPQRKSLKSRPLSDQKTLWWIFYHAWLFILVSFSCISINIVRLCNRDSLIIYFSFWVKPLYIASFSPINHQLAIPSKAVMLLIEQLACILIYVDALFPSITITKLWNRDSHNIYFIFLLRLFFLLLLPHQTFKFLLSN